MSESATVPSGSSAVDAGEISVGDGMVVTTNGRWRTVALSTELIAEQELSKVVVATVQRVQLTR